MYKKPFAILLSLLMLLGCLSGCGGTNAPADPTVPETTQAPAPTAPSDGDPDDVTCKGSYSAGSFDADAVVAQVEDYQLTNEQLQAWYAMAVAAFRQETRRDAAPDFSYDLAVQTCPIDDDVNSWQQYFLKQALNAWHSACALELQSRVQELPTEDAYQPSLDNYEKYMAGMPATDYLYGYNPLYQPNSMHDAYLTALPETLEDLAAEKGYAGLDALAEALGTTADALTDAARLYNYSYMYFTTLSYYIECTGADIVALLDADADEGNYVDIRHILLLPENGGWDACLAEAEELLAYWEKKTKHNEAAFADLANQNSDDEATALDGGAYHQLRQGQLAEELDSWCFDEARQAGDTVILQTDEGVHILYFSGSTAIAYAQAEETMTKNSLAELVSIARKRYPAQIDYSAITLAQAEAALSFSDVLYPDIAHERFPEVPLYLQQDYAGTMYGGFELRTNGCGITSFAMLASYMADDELTPPEMCALYGSYSHRNGTDGMIFTYEPAANGFYLLEKTYEPTVAKAALENGHLVISIQHKGYWTRGGHYIVLERINENGMVQVRDSNIYNYQRISSHAQDQHTWGSITSAGSGYWIFQQKITHLPACCRCGEGDSSILAEDYLCHKCRPALLRRSTYLEVCIEN